MGKFVVKATKTGFVFNLKAGNGEVIATSEIYTTEAACMKGVESVRKNAADAKLEDQTVDEAAAVTNPKFELYTDKAGEFRFRLKARNGEVIAASEGYKAKASCLNGIDSVRRNAPDAAVEKLDAAIGTNALTEEENAWARLLRYYLANPNNGDYSDYPKTPEELPA